MKVKVQVKVKVKVLVAGTCLFIILILCYAGYLWPNSVFASAYSVRGIDVSNHQKDIDWKQVSQNKDIKFAFIKATEGKDYRDKCFLTNWNQASKVDMYKGAYHYFKATNSGKEQAENFMGLVPYETGCLPPVVDIEERGLSKAAFKKELNDYLLLVTEKYHQKPIIYVVYPLYNEYIKGEFEQYPIWIRDIIMPPKISDNREWIFWQYCNRGRIKGINTYVDLNVFNGDIDKMKALLSE